MPESQWRISLLFAVVIHLLVFIIALLAPHLFTFKRKLPEVYTVNLFSVEDEAAPKPVRKIKPVVAPKKVKTKKAVAPTPPPPPTISKPKAVSLRPIKSKTKRDEERVKLLRNKLLTESKAKKARQEADKTAKDAVKRLQDALAAQQQLSDIGKDQGEAAPAPQGGSGVTVDEVTRRYLVAVNNHIQEHWILPDLQNWDMALVAIVGIKVRRDGVVIENYFESKSDNIYFNQFVEKTLEEATPFPPFSIGLKEEYLEFGLRFRPGGVF